MKKYYLEQDEYGFYFENHEGFGKPKKMQLSEVAESLNQGWDDNLKIDELNEKIDEMKSVIKNAYDCVFEVVHYVGGANTPLEDENVVGRLEDSLSELGEIVETR